MKVTNCKDWYERSREGNFNLEDRELLAEKFKNGKSQCPLRIKIRLKQNRHLLKMKWSDALQRKKIFKEKKSISIILG